MLHQYSFSVHDGHHAQGVAIREFRIGNCVKYGPLRAGCGNSPTSFGQTPYRVGPVEPTKVCPPPPPKKPPLRPLEKPDRPLLEPQLLRTPVPLLLNEPVERALDW